MSTTTAPQNVDAEESILGAMLLSKQAIEIGEEILTASDFYRPSHGIIFRAMVALHARNYPVDALTLADFLEKHKKLNDVGGKAKIIELAAIVPATSNAEHYARIVQEQAVLRRLVAAGTAIRSLGEGRGGDIDTLIAEAETHLSAVAAVQGATDFTAMSVVISEMLADIELVMETGETRTGLLTGFHELDQMLTGFYPGQLILLAARPSMGKSALAQNIAENLADRGIPSAFASLEMSKLEIALRSIARVSKIPTHKLRTGEISHVEVDKFRAAKKQVLERAAFFHVEDNPSLSVSKLRAELKRMKRQQPLGLAVVDYLQMMVTAGSEENRQAQVAGISRSLKVLARELEIPILALAQLNRNLESRQDKRPVLSDLRDSGSLEQDADVVLFIYRDEFYNPDSDAQGVSEIIVAKNRNGESHKTINLGFSGRLVSFLNLPKGGTA